MKLLTLFLLMAAPIAVYSQDFVESQELGRTFRIRYQNGSGTAFVILHNNKNYWVTARHIFDAPTGTSKNGQKVRFFISTDSSWIPTTGTLYLHSNPKVDIAIISFDDTTKFIARSISVDVEIILGDEGFFLGFPYGLGSKGLDRGFPVPLVKKFAFSGVEVRDSVEIFYLDGHNNPGFSGGPVYLWNRKNSGDKRPYLIGLVSAYVLQDNELVTPSGKIKYQENSGIIIAIGKKHILELLSQNGL